MDTGSHRRRGGWAVLAVLAIVLTVAGCGGAAGSSRELSLALAEEPDELDPTISSSFVSRMVFAHMCEKLYDVDGELQRGAAAGRGAAEGLRRRPDRDDPACARASRFNDGTPFDAAAVKQSLDRHRTLETSSRSGELAPVSGVEVVDPRTVRLAARRSPFPPLTSLLADRAGMIMSPEGARRARARSSAPTPCASGRSPSPSASPRTASWSSVRRTTTTAAKVTLDRIVFRIITDGPVRASNLRSGDVDVAERLEPVDVVSIKGDASIELHERHVARLPGDHDQRRQRGRHRQAVQDASTRRWPRSPSCARRSSSRWTARSSTRSSSSTSTCPGCSPVSPVPARARTCSARGATSTRPSG